MGRYQGWSPWPDAQAAAFLATMQALDTLPPHDWRQIGIATVDDGRLIGDVAFHLTDDGTCAEIGFTLARQAHGRGLGRDAVAALIALVFDAAPVQRIVAITDARNDPARRLLAAVGMTVVATDDAEFRGERCREETFAIARPSATG